MHNLNGGNHLLWWPVVVFMLFVYLYILCWLWTKQAFRILFLFPSSNGIAKVSPIARQSGPRSRRGCVRREVY